jgi:hypothetical protein
VRVPKRTGKAENYRPNYLIKRALARESRSNQFGTVIFSNRLSCKMFQLDLSVRSNDYTSATTKAMD